jgi:hypothetical protein
MFRGKDEEWRDSLDKISSRVDEKVAMCSSVINLYK